jgi:hypothetical protein
LRDLRQRTRDSWIDQVQEFGARSRAEAEAGYAGIEGQPWTELAVAGLDRARANGAPPFGLFSWPNPFWCLTISELVVFRIVRASEVAGAFARADDPGQAEKLWNPFMVSDLRKAGYTEREALARIALYEDFARRAGVEGA